MSSPQVEECKFRVKRDNHVQVGNCRERLVSSVKERDQAPGNA